MSKLTISELEWKNEVEKLERFAKTFLPQQCATEKQSVTHGNPTHTVDPMLWNARGMINKVKLQDQLPWKVFFNAFIGINVHGR